VENLIPPERPSVVVVEPKGRVTVRGLVSPRGAYRSPEIGGLLLMQTPVYALGSPNQSEYAPIWTLRLVAGTRAIVALVTAAAAPLSFASHSIARSQRGNLVEGGVGIRWLPLQHERVRFGPWIQTLFDRTSIRLAIDDGGRSLRIHKLQWEVLLETGLELDFTLVRQTPTRPVRIAGVLATALRLAFPLGTKSRFSDGEDTWVEERAPVQLRTLGSFAGAAATVVVGLQVVHELPGRR
jgi:hypothetical protein